MTTDLRTGPEKMLFDELAALGVTLEALIIRTPRDWVPDLYAYRLTTKSGGVIATNVIPWDIDTYPKVLAAAKGN